MKQIVTNTIARAHIAISNTKARLVNLVRKEDGATAVEYAVMVALIAAAIIAIVYTLGGTVKGIFSQVNDCLANPSSCIDT